MAAVTDVTQLLQEIGSSGRDVNDLLYITVYDELRAVAKTMLAKERTDHTLSPTALVHEAYLKMVDQSRVEWANSRHFFLVAGQAMRRILVNHARARKAEKRWGGKHRLQLSELHLPLVSSAEEMLDVDDVLKRLEQIDERKSQAVVLRYFCGYSVEETAKILNISSATLHRDWCTTKAWIYREMGETKH